jgi:hypothetical protein
LETRVLTDDPSLDGTRCDGWASSVREDAREPGTAPLNWQEAWYTNCPVVSAKLPEATALRLG